jgi:hypothetical protein
MPIPWPGLFLKYQTRRLDRCDRPGRPAGAEFWENHAVRGWGTYIVALRRRTLERNPSLSAVILRILLGSASAGATEGDGARCRGSSG